MKHMLWGCPTQEEQRLAHGSLFTSPCDTIKEFFEQQPTTPACRTRSCRQKCRREPWHNALSNGKYHLVRPDPDLLVKKILEHVFIQKLNRSFIRCPKSACLPPCEWAEAAGPAWILCM